MSRASVVLSVIGWLADKVIYGLPFFLFAAGDSESAANGAYFPDHASETLNLI